MEHWKHVRQAELHREPVHACYIDSVCGHAQVSLAVAFVEEVEPGCLGVPAGFGISGCGNSRRGKSVFGRITSVTGRPRRRTARRERTQSQHRSVNFECNGGAFTWLTFVHVERKL